MPLQFSPLRNGALQVHVAKDNSILRDELHKKLEGVFRVHQLNSKTNGLVVFEGSETVFCRLSLSTDGMDGNGLKFAK